MIKILGTLDILAGLFLWVSVLIPIPELVLGIFGVYLLAKGLVFVGFGMDFLSILDIAVGFIVVFSASINLHPIVISVVSMYLIGKGSLSLA